jgi:hypothetical protein
VNRNQAARNARESKERHPEHYCAAPGCLWRTWSANSDDEKPCPHHAPLQPRHNDCGLVLHYSDREGNSLPGLTTDECCQRGVQV